MGTIVRAILAIVGLVQLLAGFALIVGGGADAPGGLWLMAIGAFLLVIPFVERARYRSEATEHGTSAVGPGGGETTEAPLEPRFRPTPEAFVDPTSGHRMRVLVDPQTGERRYVADGDR